nr:hypothetical protein [Tanacetum cinerariifolium]
MIKLFSRHQNTQQYDAILPIELTNEPIKNLKSYKEYYDIASGAEPHKTKASVGKKQSSSDTTITMPPQTAKGKRLKTLAKVDKPAKEKQHAKTSKAKDEGTGIIPGVPNVPTYESDDEEISWKSSEDNDDDEVKISEHDDDVDEQSDDDDQDDDDDDEQTNSDNNGDDFVHPKYNDEDSHGMNVDGDKGANEEDDGNELYGDVNINMEGQDIQMAEVHITQVIKDTHVTLYLVNPEGQQQSSSVSSYFVSNMLNPSLDTCIDSIFESTPWEDVSVTTTAERPLLSATTLPLLSIPIISHVQQTLALSRVNVPSSSLQDLPNFGSLFGFNHRLKTLETNFSEFMKTNQFTEAISSIPDNKGASQKQFKEQVSKILPKTKKAVNELLKDEVLTRSSNSSKTYHAVAADLSELELKKILIDKMESNKSIHISDEQKNLYKELVDAYECDKLTLDTYGDTVTLKRRRDDEDKDEEPSTRSNRGSKRRRSAPTEEPMHTTKDLKEPAPQEFKTGATDDQPIEEASQHPHWFQKQAKPRTPDRAWNKTLPATHGPFVMNRLKVDTLTPELLAGPTYELMKGSSKILVELEFFLEEVYKATTDQLDWNNPKGQQYPHELLKPLPLIPNSRGRHVIPFDYFINNDLEYLCGGVSIQKYTTLVIKTKAADYGHIKWIKDLVPHTMESARDVYSKRRIIVVTELQIIEWHKYKHLDWITVCRDDDKLYKFKEGDFKRLLIQDIEDMLLLLVQGKLTNLTIDERFAFNVSF